MRKKVAIVITRLDLGGAQQVALETAQRLDVDGRAFEVQLICGKGGALDSEAARLLGSRFLPLRSLKHSISPLFDVLAFLQLVWIFFRQGTDIVHTHSSKAGLLGRLAAWVAGVPWVMHTVHGWSFHDFMPPALRQVLIWLEQGLALITDRFCVVAESCRTQARLEGVGMPGQYALLRAGVDLSVWRSAKRSRVAIRKLLPALKPSDLVVGCIANCKPQKNPLDFVHVAGRVLRSFPRARFVYLGGGPLLQTAQSLAAQLGIDSHVHFLGWTANPLPLAQGFDIFLLTSRWEGLPCVLPQALSLGLPVVATCVDGVSEIVREGMNGYLCAAGDTAALASRVRALLCRPRLRRRLSTAARRSVGREFSFEAMAQRTQELYLEPFSFPAGIF